MSRRPERLRQARSRAVALVISGLVCISAMTACTNADPDAAPSATRSATSPAPSPSVAPVPALVPDGSAEENLAFFSSIVSTVWASPAQAQGRAYIDALVAAGFDKAAMQVTNDTSTVGNAAESIQFSVLWDDECLVGQVGPSTGAPVAVVVPALAEGTCLIGETRPIDW
ncbi:MAG: hypothetical protein ABWY55_09090 [Microbacterium sp.]